MVLAEKAASFGRVLWLVKPKFHGSYMHALTCLLGQRYIGYHCMTHDRITSKA